MQWYDTFMAIFGYKRVKQARTRTAEAPVMTVGNRNRANPNRNTKDFQATLNEFETQTAFKMPPKARGIIVAQLIRDVKSGEVTPTQANRFNAFRKESMQKTGTRNVHVLLTSSRSEFDKSCETLGFSGSEFVAFAIHRHLERMESKGAKV